MEGTTGLSVQRAFIEFYVNLFDDFDRMMQQVLQPRSQSSQSNSISRSEHESVELVKRVRLPQDIHSKSVYKSKGSTRNRSHHQHKLEDSVPFGKQCRLNMNGIYRDVPIPIPCFLSLASRFNTGGVSIW